MPLDGCPRCGYAYDREPGYFLLSIWAINYGFGSLIGLTIYLTLEILYDLPLELLLAAVLAPELIFNLGFVRHSKAYFIAFDHWWDPHQRGGGDGDGNRPNIPPPPAPSTPESVPPAPETPIEELVGSRH